MLICVDGRVWSSSEVQISVLKNSERCQRAFLAKVEGKKGRSESTDDHNRYNSVLGS